MNADLNPAGQGSRAPHGKRMKQWRTHFLLSLDDDNASHRQRKPQPDSDNARQRSLS